MQKITLKKSYKKKQIKLKKNLNLDIVINLYYFVAKIR